MAGEAAFLHEVEIDARQRHGRLDLGAVADDAGVLHQRVLLRFLPARDLFWIEAVERDAEGRALAQDRDPGESGLEAVEHELLEHRLVVIFGHAPFLVVIGQVKRIDARPRTAHEAVGAARGGDARGGFSRSGIGGSPLSSSLRSQGIKSSPGARRLQASASGDGI